MNGIADYVFVRQLGQGNYGTFHLARPPDRLGHAAEYVAVKVLAHHAHDDAFRRVAKELQHLAAVTSPHLVRLLDAGQHRGRLFYVTEYLADGSLAAPRTPLSRAAVLRALADAARGAHALHEAGIAHRDIKPTNILLTDGHAKLADLGLAQALTPGQTVTGIGPVGAIEYISPAIILGRRASRASDIWSIGITMHRALTGRSVYGTFPDNDVVVALRYVLATRPQLAPGLRADEADVIASCLNLDGVEPPPTAQALAERIDTTARVDAGADER